MNDEYAALDREFEDALAKLNALVADRAPTVAIFAADERLNRAIDGIVAFRQRQRAMIEAAIRTACQSRAGHGGGRRARSTAGSGRPSRRASTA